MGRGRPTIGRHLACTVLVALAAAVSVSPALAAPAGEVSLERNATSSFAIPWITTSTSAEREWMRETYTRMRGYPPFHDQALAWGPPTDFYQDLYALYRDVSADQSLMQKHPSWVLRDGAGNRLFIPWACSNGTCPAYAADIGNAEWRAAWIERAEAELAKGYRGVFIDNVNMDLMVGNGQGQIVRPMDPRTGAPMTDSNWRRYVAEFTEEIREALPDALITHNAGQWWTSHSDPYYQREIRAADRIELERGFSDPGLPAGTGTYGYETFLAHAEWVHSLGPDFVAESYSLDQTRAVFELGSYLLVSRGADSLATDWNTNPNNWWSGWGLDLGAAEGSRQSWSGLLRRDFDGGIALVNPPGAVTRTVSLPGGSEWTNLNGVPVTSVTLTARQAAVLRRAPLAPPPPPPDPDPPPPDPDPPPPTSESDPIADTQLPHVTLKPKKHRIRRGGRLVFRGRAPDAEHVEVQERRGSSWRTVASGASAEGGSYRLRVRAQRAGLRRFRAAAPGLLTSRVVRVRVSD